MDNKLSSHWPISLTNGVATLFNLFLPLVLVRIITPEEVGRYKIFFLYVMLSPGLFLVGGLSNGLYHWAGSYPKTKDEVRQSWTWLVGIALLVSAVGLALTSELAPLIKMPRIDLQIFFLFCPLGLACIFLEDLMIARGDIWTGSLYGSGFQVLRSAVTLGAAFWQRSVEAVLWAFFGCTVLRAFAGYLVLRKTGDIQPFFSREKSAQVLRYAFPVSIAALSNVALANVDQLILSTRLNTADFAFYAMGCLTVPPLLVLEMSVNRILIPNLSKAFASRDLAKAAALFSEGVLELYRILLPATVGLIIYSHPIIKVLFTERYSEAAHYLQFYALFYLFMSIPTDAVARAKGDGVWIMRTSLLFAPLSILATWWAAVSWGAMGALIAFLAVHVMMRLYSLSYQKSRFCVPYAKFLPLRQMLLQTGLVLIAGAVSWAARPFFRSDMMWFLGTGLSFIAIYFGGTCALLLRPSRGSKEPIHVLELVQFLSVGGLERMVYSLSHALNQDDRFRTQVATYDRLDEAPEATLVPQFEKAGISVVQWHKKTGFSPRIVTRLVRMAFSGKKQILHAHDLGPLIYGSLAKGLLFGRVQLVLTLHTLLHIEKSRRYRLYFKYFLRFVDRIIAVSPSVKAGLVALGVSPARIEVVPNGVAFAARPLGDPGERRALKERLLPGASPALYAARWMLCLGRLHSGKGQDIALDVWRALAPEDRAELALIVVGPPTEKSFVETLTEKRDQLPDAERVVLAGATHHPEAWLQAAHLFFSGSAHEGMPLAPLEAAGSGLPTLLSDIPGHKFLKPWARFFVHTRPEDGAHRVMDILTDIETQGETAYFVNQWEAARSLRETWSETTMAASYKDVFESIWKAPEAKASHLSTETNS